MKNKILTILCVFMLFSFCFINSVFAVDTETDTLIVDGYDMSDVYRLFSKDDAFFIVNWGGYSEEYYVYVPRNSDYKSYCAISPATSCLYYNSNWEPLDGNSYDFYKFNFNTLRFEKDWSGHANDWTLNNTALVFAYASKGIYNQDHTTFFLNPPVQLGIVAQKLEATKMEPLREILTLVPIMIMLLVSYLGLRKGLTFIKTLRKM